MNPLLHRRTESYKDDETKFIHRRVDIVRGDGNFAQMPHHDDIYHVERGIDELLKRNGNRDHEQFT